MTLFFRCSHVGCMELKLHSFLVVLIVGILLTSGCTSSDSSNSASSSQTTPHSKNLSAVALRVDDLPQGWTQLGANNNDIKNDTFEQTFVYVGGSSNKLMITLIGVKSNDEAHQTYLSVKSGFPDAQDVSIGNEGYSFSETKKRVITFRRDNAIVILNMVSYPPVSTSDLLKIAKIIDNKIIS